MHPLLVTEVGAPTIASVESFDLAPIIQSRQQERRHRFSPTEEWSSTEKRIPWNLRLQHKKRSSPSAAREVRTKNGERQSSEVEKTRPTCVIRNESCINSDVAACSAKGVLGCVLGQNVCSRERERARERETGDEEALG